MQKDAIIASLKPALDADFKANAMRLSCKISEYCI
jgi:hypothetical protein